MPSRQQIPPVGDPRWEGWCAPLEEFLSEAPRTWDELNEWQRKNKVRPSLLLQMLCWLEFNHRVVAVTDGGPTLWFATRERSK
jgi:hypothetical protein